MTDDDRTPSTPPTRTLTDEERLAHFDDYPPGAPAVETRLDARLHRVERDNDTLRREVASLLASRDANRKILWLVIPALVGALATVLVFAAEKIASSSERSGKMEATIDALKDQQRGDREEIAQLRAALLRLSGGEHRPPTSDDLRSPDKYSLLDQGVGAGGRDPHLPKLHVWHPRCGKIVHSTLLLQMSPQTSGWRMRSMSRARSIDSSTSGDPSAVGAEGPDCGGSLGGLQPATTTRTMMTPTKAILFIPEM